MNIKELEDLLASEQATLIEMENAHNQFPSSEIEALCNRCELINQLIEEKRKLEKARELLESFCVAYECEHGLLSAYRKAKEFLKPKTEQE